MASDTAYWNDELPSVQQNHKGFYATVTTSLISQLFPDPSNPLPLKRVSWESLCDGNSYIQVGKTDGDKLTCEAIEQSGLQYPHMDHELASRHDNELKREVEQWQVEGMDDDRNLHLPTSQEPVPKKDIIKNTFEIEYSDKLNIQPPSRTITPGSESPRSVSSPVVSPTKRKRANVQLISSKMPKRSMKLKKRNIIPSNPLLEKVREIQSSRSYPTEKLLCFGQTSKYYSKPSPLQLASFGKAVVNAVHSSDSKRLESLLSAGLSPNPCNTFGESILDKICKRGDEELFRIATIKCGASIQTTDSFGRTPLHYAMWCCRPRFSIVEYLMSNDDEMVRVADKFGKTPLEYVSETKTDEWIEFFCKKQDTFWPVGGSNSTKYPGLVQKVGDTLPDPPTALSKSDAEDISSGLVEPSRSSYYKCVKA